MAVGSFTAVFASLMVSASAFAAPDLAQQLCLDPWTAICLEPANRSAALEKSVAQARARIRREAVTQAALPKAKGGCGATPSPEMIASFKEQGYSSDEARIMAILDATHDMGQVQKVLCLGKIIEKKVFLAIAPVMTREQVLKTFEDVRIELMAAIREQMSTDPARAALAEEMASLVAKHQFILSDRYEEYGQLQSPKDASGKRQVKIEWISNPDSGICGPDFLTRNMFSTSTGYVDAKTKQATHTGLLGVVGCPGQWLELLNVPFGKPEQVLWQVFGHELSHQVHATRNRVADKVVLEDGTAMTFNAVPNYTSWISCVNQAYAVPVLPELSSSAKENSYNKFLEAELGRAPTSVDWRLNELSADDWGHIVLTRLASKRLSTPVERGQAAANSMRRLCRLPDGKLGVTHTDTHPSGRFRIEALLRQQPFREALGCATGTTPGAERPDLVSCRF